MLKTRGLLISLEGIDGCGKTTQAELLGGKLAQSGVDYITVREPGGTVVGEKIRQILLNNQYSPSLQAEMLLYMAARSELTKQVMLPALLSGKVIVCDRFTDSTLAYQGYGGGADLSLIRLLNLKATDETVPHITVLLDLTVEEAAKRRGASADRMESKDIRFHRRVRNGYLEIARQEPHRVSVVDASEVKEEQSEIIWQLVQGKIAGSSSARSAYEF